MPLVVYPDTLPPPSVPWESLLRARAARSSLLGNPHARPRWRDQIEDVVSASWVYSAAEMAIWRPWWKETLLDGQLWFAAVAPGFNGFIDRVMRYRPQSVRVQPFGAGGCRISAQLEVRGLSAPPQAGAGVLLGWVGTTYADLQVGANTALHGNDGSEEDAIWDTTYRFYFGVEDYSGGEVVFVPQWTTAFGDPEPTLFDHVPGKGYVMFPERGIGFACSRGILRITASIDDVPIGAAGDIEISSGDTEYPSFAWGPVP